MLKQFVVIKDKLNIRSRPSADSDETFVGTLLKDEIVFLDDQAVAGTIPAGATTNLWLKDTFNRFVTGDGVRLRSFADKKADFLKNNGRDEFFGPGDRNDERNWNFSWGHVDLDVWQIWRDFGCQGEGIRVAVIDTGVLSAGNDLKDRISAQSLSILPGPLNDMNSVHHGTMSAGIIGANAANTKTVFGVAPACEVIVIRTGDSVFDSMDIFTAVEKARALKPHIITMSIERDIETTAFRNLIRDCTADGILVLAAAGDTGDATISFPGAYPDCISVGAYALDAGHLPQLYAKSNRNAMVKLLAPGHDIRSTSPTQDPVLFDASSAATAFAAGLFALVLGCCKKAASGGTSAPLPKPADIVEALQKGECAIPITGALGEGFGILQPLLLIEHLLKK